MSLKVENEVLQECLIERDTRIARLEKAIKDSLAYCHKPGCKCSKTLTNRCSRELLLEALASPPVAGTSQKED